MKREFTLVEFIKIFPGFLKYLISAGIDITDENYIVRLTPHGIEIGYPEDDWVNA